MLSVLSHRYMSVPQLMVVSGMVERQVLRLLAALDERGVLVERNFVEPDFLIGQLDPPGPVWWRRAWRAVTRGPSE